MSTAPPHERTKIKVLACEVVAGDWTEFSGWREVVDVRPLPGKRIGLVRADGKTRRIDKFNRDDDVIVYRDQEQHMNNIQREENHVYRDDYHF